MKRIVMLAVLLAVGFCVSGNALAEVKIQLWTQAGEAEGAYQFVQKLCKAFTEQNPDIKIDVVQKDTEVLREDFQTASLAGNPPDLLWTVSDHAGPFTKANLLQPVDDLFDLNAFVDSAVKGVQLGGKTWGVPVTNGNHLMLMYNTDFVKEPPQDTDALVKIAKELTKEGRYGLVWNQGEPFWLTPWLTGFGGKLFGDDGVTPTLDTPEMIATLKFAHDLKFTEKILPPESDYDGASALFKEGKAAMLVNGDWSVGDYKKVLGEKFAVAPLPKIVATGKWPSPYTSGKFLMISASVKDQKLEAIMKIVDFMTSEASQLDMVKTLSQLPTLKKVLESEAVTTDPILKGSAAQMQLGTPMPIVMEMRCNWDAMRPELNAVMSDKKSPEDAAKAMQAAADACVKGLKK